jgi:hypothetical protein
MYRCQITGRQSREGEKLNKVTVLTRAVTYKNWDKEAEEEWFSQGTEIVKELNCCEEGRLLWEGWNEEQRALFLKRS